MHTSFKAALGAVLTTAVVFSVPTFSAAATATTAGATPVAASAVTSGGASTKAEKPRKYTRAEATAIFHELQAALSPKDLPKRKLGDPLPRKDLGRLMREAQLAKGSMTARQASIIDGGRPVPKSANCTTPFLSPWKVVESAHFCVHYRDGLSASSGGASLAQAQETLYVMEKVVYVKEVGVLGYQPPVNDGDGKTDVFLDQLGDQGYYGFCTTDSGASTSTAWCGLDNDFARSEFGADPGASLRVTAAHEFFHAIQFGYDANESDWFMEGTAVWMEDFVYDGINDYLQYLNYSQIVKPRNALDYAGGLERYGAVTWWKYMSERFRSNNIIREVWNAARVSAGGRNAIQAVVAVLKARGYKDFPLEFARYAVWNTLPPGTYSERGAYPSPGAWARGTLSRKAKDTGTLDVRVNHLATAPLVLKPSKKLPSRAQLKLIIDAPNTNRGTEIRVQVRYRSGKVATYVMPLNAAGNGKKRFPFNPKKVRTTVITMTNGSTGYYNNQMFKIRAIAKY
ncbi:hypothetical protein ABIE44_000735 [Marmoricola sp. OAE513]|uniref:MXAN_6640 family putative metalloprotease n=1 Tax=Marmoricola sp. OAE513 TaxID=2817894 RepID=UPI001AE84E40